MLTARQQVAHQGLIKEVDLITIHEIHMIVGRPQPSPAVNDAVEDPSFEIDRPLNKHGHVRRILERKESPLLLLRYLQ